MTPTCSRRARWWALVPLLLAACSGQGVGPHGGVLLTIDPGELCVEVCFERDADTVRLRFTGGDGTTPLAIEAGDVDEVFEWSYRRSGNVPDGSFTTRSEGRVEPARGMVDAVTIHGVSLARVVAMKFDFRYQGRRMRAHWAPEVSQ